MIEMKNTMEGLVEKALNEYLENKNGICQCEKCKLDMKAYALNKLPAHYIVNQRGFIHEKMDEMQTQFSVDVLKVVIEAVQQISKRPRH